MWCLMRLAQGPTQPHGTHRWSGKCRCRRYRTIGGVLWTAQVMPHHNLANPTFVIRKDRRHGTPDTHVKAVRKRTQYYCGYFNQTVTPCVFLTVKIRISTVKCEPIGFFCALFLKSAKKRFSPFVSMTPFVVTQAL